MKVGAVFAAMASVALWGVDFVGLPRFELAQEAKLFTVHVVLGAALGVLIGIAFRDKVSSTRIAALAAAITLTLGVLALLAMVGTYPQLFAERWWLRGGVLAWLQVTVTHTIGPRVLDFLLVALIASVALAASIRCVWRRRKVAALAALSVGALVIVMAREGRPARASETTRPTNVLIIAAESLDDVEGERTMPYVASRTRDGSLFRHAVTPIARSYPSWVSTLTGTEPRAHGVRHSYPRASVRRNVGKTLFTELRDRGYATFVASDGAGGVFSGFDSGFESVAAPELTMAALERGALLHRHRFSLALLRFRWFRRLFPEWRNVPLLADPDWIVDDAVAELDRSGERPFAGLVVFGASSAPYLAPDPYYKLGDPTYRGRYLYHESPIAPPAPPSEKDERQLEARYHGALLAIDRAIERLSSRVEDDTLVVITGAHGPLSPGHGDTVQSLRSQTAPVLVLGPGVPAGLSSNAQVRLFDLPATVLERLGGSSTFGDGVTLFDADAPRPVCVETGIWLPSHVRATRLDYAGISRLVAVDETSDELVLRPDAEDAVENAKERGLVLGHRIYREQLTTRGLERHTRTLKGPAHEHDATDLSALFEKRCIEADANLSRLYGAVVFERMTP